jgi:CRISPR/Cas system-associated exonuclease Cas4 (RecB family)
MEDGLPEVENEWSAEGQLLHFAAGTEDFTKLTLEQTELVKEKLALRDRFLESLELIGWVKRIEVELPYTLKDKIVFLNHADFVMVGKGKVAIVDYKFGYEEVDAPELNEQLAVYIACLAERFDVPEYYGLIIPRFGKPAPPVKYTRAEIPALRKMIEYVYDACIPEAPRTPGLKQCRYCRGFQLGMCKEAISMAMNPVHKFSEKLLQNPGQVLQSMEPELRTKLFDAFAMADKLRKTFVAAVKPMIERDPEFLPGYKLSREGETRTKVTSILSLNERLIHLGIDPDDVIQNFSISNKSLTELVRKHTGLKGKELDAKVEEICRGLVDSIPVERSLERV